MHTSTRKAKAIKKQTATLGQYKLGRTLGKGVTARVLYAVNE